MKRKKKIIENELVKVVRKKDHLEVHYSDGSIIRTLHFTSGNTSHGMKYEDRPQSSSGRKSDTVA